MSTSTLRKTNPDLHDGPLCMMDQHTLIDEIQFIEDLEKKKTDSLDEELGYDELPDGYLVTNLEEHERIKKDNHELLQQKEIQFLRICEELAKIKADCDRRLKESSKQAGIKYDALSQETKRVTSEWEQSLAREREITAKLQTKSRELEALRRETQEEIAALKRSHQTALQDLKSQLETAVTRSRELEKMVTAKELVISEIKQEKQNQAPLEQREGYSRSCGKDFRQESSVYQRRPETSHSSCRSFLQENTIAARTTQTCGNTSKDLEITISVGASVFYAQKRVLTNASPVFADLLNPSSPPPSRSTGKLTITQIEAEVFEQVLHFIYTGYSPKLTELVYPLYRAAHVFKLEKLLAACENEISPSLSVVNVCSVLALVNGVPGPNGKGVNRLREKALVFFIQNHKTVMLTCYWKTFSTDYPDLAQEALALTKAG